MKSHARWFGLAFLAAVMTVMFVACGGAQIVSAAIFDTATFDGAATFGP